MKIIGRVKEQLELKRFYESETGYRVSIQSELTLFDLFSN